MTTGMADGTDRRGLAAAALVLLLGLLAVGSGSPVAAQAPASPVIVVNDVGDGPDADPLDGRCRTATGVCTLRAAVDEANARVGADTITFDIPGNGVKRIVIGTTLWLNDPTGGTTIDGYSQPGARPNTDPLVSNAAIRIEITNTTRLDPMLLIESAENTVRGLSIWGQGDRIELRNEQTDGNVIAGNFIGMDAAASDGLPRATHGVVMNLGPDRNLIGGSAPADRNVIGGNGYGIRIQHGETSENVVENNLFGLDPTGVRRMNQGYGVDLQWWTWGNYVTGNLFAGMGIGVDLSHTTLENVVIGNRMGTAPNGNTTSEVYAIDYGVALKDNPVDNVIADNVIGTFNQAGIWSRHNYNGATTIVGNRIGVGSQGADVAGAAIGTPGVGIQLRGHDDLIQDNIFANMTNAAVQVRNDTPPMAWNTTYPAEQTLANLVRQNTYYNATYPFIDIIDTTVGQDSNDAGDADDGSHRRLNHPEITGIGPGQVFGLACANCQVEAYVSGAVGADGTLDPDAAGRGVGAAWIGRAEADAQGRFSLAANAIRAGKDLMLIAIDPEKNTSELSPRRVVPPSFVGSGGTASPSLPAFGRPTIPGRPPAHEGSGFSCRLVGDSLSWRDAGAGEYYVFFTVGETEGYVGPVRGTSVSAPPADSYRVEHWVSGFATNATCPGGGVPAFTCSFQAGTLRWDDAGADAYYVFATTDGVERYLGPHSGTSLGTAPAESYRIEHWRQGRATNTTCPGPGAPAFTCSFQAGTLRWDDAGVEEYYVFSTRGGVERYLGPVRATSTPAPTGDSYRVEHWATGRVTNAVCAP